MGIEYVVGDATDPAPDPEGRPIVIAHVVNNRGGWGRGFVVALARRWPKAEMEYRSWHADRTIGSGFGLGAVRFVRVAPRVTIAHMVAQDGYWSQGSPPPIDYSALDSCLEDVAREAFRIGGVVVGPRFGAGLAGGSWKLIEESIKKHLIDAGVQVRIYDLPR